MFSGNDLLNTCTGRWGRFDGLHMKLPSNGRLRARLDHGCSTHCEPARLLLPLNPLMAWVWFWRLRSTYIEAVSVTLVETVTYRRVIVKWEFRVDTLRKLLAHLAPFQHYLLRCKVSTDRVSQDAEKALHVVSWTGAWMFWWQATFRSSSPHPLTALYCCRQCHESLPCQSTNTT